MDWFLLVLGVVLVLLGTLDALWTTLWVDGAGGPVARRLIRWANRLPRWDRVRHRRGILSVTGVFVMVGTMVVWTVCVWAGWTLVFLSDAQAVVASSDGTPADVWSRVYYTGFSLFTLGNGDYVPQGAFYQVATALTAGNGLVLFTLGLSYLITIIGAMVKERALATQVLASGDTPESFVRTAWTGERFEGLAEAIMALGTPIARTAERHLAYPVLHAYHSRTRQKSFVVALAVLDEALTLVEHGVKTDTVGRDPRLRTTRGAIRSFLDMARTHSVGRSEGPPPVPSLASLREAGIPTVDDATFREKVEATNDRRRVLLQLIQSDGWSWEDVVGRGDGP